jgi:hypothetical protein
MMEVKKVASKYSPTINICETDFEEVKRLKIGDEVKLSAIGKVINLSEDKIWEDEKQTDRKRYSARMELSDIEIDNITEDDRKEAEADGLKVTDYKKIKSMKEKVNKIRDEGKRQTE